jgi:hypothetical protein
MLKGNGGGHLRIQPHLLALLASMLLAGCDVGANDFLGEWKFVSGTLEGACFWPLDQKDAGTSTSPLMGNETFVVADGGGLELIEAALGFPPTCRLAVTIDGSTAVTSHCYHDPSTEGYGVFDADPLRFEMSSDGSTLTFTGGYRTGSMVIAPACSYSASGVLRRP